MVTTTYEEIYVSVRAARSDVKNLHKLIHFLQTTARPVTAKEAGTALWGEYEYTKGAMARSFSSSLGQMMRHLRQYGYVKVSEIDGTPVIVRTMEYIEPTESTPRYIKVWDKDGKEYDYPNPDYDYRKNHGSWEEVEKTITPRVKCYQWVG